MPEFGAIAQSESLGRVYKTVVDKIGLTTHPDFLRRPIKVLDIGGGTGPVGSLLKESCEGLLGELSPEDLSEIVDYVNLDVDRHALAHSVGRVIHANVTSAYDLLRDEEPFDYVLAINTAPNITTYTREDLDRMRIPSEQIDIRTAMTMSSIYMKSHLARITLISTALLLSQSGNSIQVGVIGDDVVHGIATTSRDLRLGLKIRLNEKIGLDEETVGMLVEFDSNLRKGKQFNQLTDYYRRNYRMLVMGQSLEPDRGKVVASLANYQETQERFWM